MSRQLDLPARDRSSRTLTPQHRETTHWRAWSTDCKWTSQEVTMSDRAHRILESLVANAFALAGVLTLLAAVAMLAGVR